MWYLIVSIPDLCRLSYFQDQLSLNAAEKFCRMLQWEQGELSAILLTFIKLPFVIKTFVLSIFECPFYTGFTVFYIFSYMVNIRDASDEQKGGGYDPRMACHRALMDAFSGLFLYQSPDEVPS